MTDRAGFLSPAVRQTLDSQLEAYERSTGRQVLVYIDRTTNGVPIEDFAVKTFAGWRVGRKGIDDGLVLFVFAQDHSLRFEVGYGLEDKLPDALASRIIREVIVPRIQAGRNDEAIVEGVRLALATIDGTNAGPTAGVEERGGTGAASGRAPPQRSLTLAQKVIFALLAVGFLILLITNPSLAIYLLFSILSSGRGGGSGGGGGFSGGGGRSGGGGASGSW